MHETSTTEPAAAHGVRVDRDGRVATVHLGSPDRPFTLTVESVAELQRVWRWVRSSGIPVVILRGTERGWCVGGDISVFAEHEQPEDYIDDLADALHRLVSEITRSDAICIAAIDGVVAGAGTPLAAAADVLVASERARFTLGYTRLALTPDGGTTLLSATVGLHATLHAALLNPTWSALEAQRRGLVAEVVAVEELVRTAEAMAARLAALPSAPLAATKRLIRQRALPDAEAALRSEAMEVRRAAGTPQAREAFTAFMAKRSPRFPV